MLYQFFYEFEQNAILWLHGAHLNGPVKDSKSYRPISLPCVPYKILQRLTHARVEAIVDPLLPREQAGFRRGRLSVD